MPFRSRSQLRTCFSRRPKGWNCKQWLSETPSACCLPEKSDKPAKCRKQRKGEPIIGKVQTGTRGGKYFTISEKDKSGKKMCEIKVYISRGK